jgi:outer membrane protein assembly factor BamD
MSTYPEFSRLDLIYFYLGDSYFMLRQYDQAVPYFTKVVTDYPGGKLAKAAAKKLAEIEKLKAAATAAPPVKK